MRNFQRDPGVNREQKWRVFDWKMPPNHLADCWWITNLEKRGAPPELLNCSLVRMSRWRVKRAGGCLPGAHLHMKYEVQLSGILAVDKRTTEQLVSQENEDARMAENEATGLVSLASEIVHCQCNVSVIWPRCRNLVMCIQVLFEN